MGSSSSKQPVLPPSTIDATSSSNTKTDSSTAVVEPPVRTNTEPKSNGGCPMHNSDGTYSYDWWKVISGEFFKQHGPSGPQPLTKEEAETKTQSKSIEDTTKTPTSTGTINRSSGCPVKHNSASSTIPLSASLNGGGGGGGCPVKHQGMSSSTSQRNDTPPEYNVYGQPIDPTNNMPYNPNQLPSFNQTIPLSTHRVASSIPKGGGGSEEEKDDSKTPATTWLYPSPQMFYNALQRKNKLTDDSDTNGNDNETSPPVLQPQDIESVVAIHNNMNEKTWYKILQWESIVHNQSVEEIEPKLLKFQGRPMDLSPKAAIKYYVFGHPLPYDRHDWIVERNGGTSQQRYVIDYYYDASLGRTDPESAIPDLHDRNTGSPSLLVDVRPALDSVTALYHRMITMPYAQYKNTAVVATKPAASEQVHSNDVRPEKYEYLPLWPSSTMKSQVNESIQVWQEIRKNSYPTSAPTSKDIDDETTKKRENLNQIVKEELTSQFQQAVQNCQKEQYRMNQACSNVTDNDDDHDTESNTLCAKASIDLTLCMGSILCPIQHAAFRQTIQQQQIPSAAVVDDNDSTIIDDALTRLQDCLKYKSRQYQQQMNKK